MTNDATNARDVSVHWHLPFSVAIALFFTGCEEKKNAPPPPPPPKVQVITVTPKDVPVFKQWIGTLDGYPNAQIRAQVSGYLMTQNYAEGGIVKKGDQLFEIDPRPFQATLDQTLGKLAQDEAMLGRTELDVKRYTPLAKEQAISQETLDDAIQANLMAKAAVQSDNAAVESARLNLSFCNITSPIDGIAGTAMAQIGDLVGPSTPVLTTVSTVDPIRVYFNVSEQAYLESFKHYTNAAGRLAHEDELKLQLILSDGSTYPQSGKWFFTSRQVNINTGTLQIAGVFPNPDYILRPGGYARVLAATENHKGAILIPQRAVAELQGAYQVATVDNQNKVHVKNVTVGDQIGSDWLIEKGIQAGDQIVVEGILKAKDGVTVDPQPYEPPSTKKVPSDNITESNK